MTTVQIATLNTSASETSFWTAVNVLLNKAHVINKRLWGQKVLFKVNSMPMVDGWEAPVHVPKLVSVDNINTDNILNGLNLKLCTYSVNDVEIQLVKLLPKNFEDENAYQLICLIRRDLRVIFYNVTPTFQLQNLCPDFSYILSLKDSNICLEAHCDENTKSYIWLKNILLPQFKKWSVDCSTTTSIQVETLTLVSNEKYYSKYNELKIKYGKEMVKIWPECTDPSKFVYEDVAIATYILLLWEDERKELNTNTLQSFVDLGCGNGLLVYILSMEGHSGLGVDVRKRQIWDLYPDNVILKEQTVTPSDINLFPQTDWIIGNHSDELTPWIPVVSARSSYKCNFFLLPCCAYNFDGTKYRRKNSSISQYTEYLNYISNLCMDCGFNVSMDRLKIPSTKRICLVGRGRTYQREQHGIFCNKIQNIINKTTESPENNSDIWIQDFKARDAVEKVRNCTKIEKNLVETIVNTVSQYLLDDCKSDIAWSIGKTVELHEIIKLIPQASLKSLKSECGGLQTLLKNNHHIFKVQSGKVQLRYPKSIEDISNEKTQSKLQKNIKIQKRPCWFFRNHPLGCPLTKENCSYLHFNEDQINQSKCEK